VVGWVVFGGCVGFWCVFWVGGVGGGGGGGGGLLVVSGHAAAATAGQAVRH